MKMLLALVVVAATTAVASPADLLTDDVPGAFELADGAAADLTFDEYAPLSPDATAHVAAGSAEAASMRAAVDVWTAGDDDILLREVTRWSDAEAAREFVEQAVLVGTQAGLSPTDAPFEGGVAYVGDDAGLRSRTLAWRQGPYAMTVSQFAANASTDEVVGAAAAALAAAVEAATGHEIEAAGAATTTGGSSGSTAPASSGGGIPITTVLLWLAIIGGAIWLFVKLRRRASSGKGRADGASRPSTNPPDSDEADESDDTDLDDIIERARARGRAEAEVEAIPDPTREWTEPKDF